MLVEILRKHGRNSPPRRSVPASPGSRLPTTPLGKQSRMDSSSKAPTSPASPPLPRGNSPHLVSTSRKMMDATIGRKPITTSPNASSKSPIAAVPPPQPSIHGSSTCPSKSPTPSAKPSATPTTIAAARSRSSAPASNPLASTTTMRTGSRP